MSKATSGKKYFSSSEEEEIPKSNTRVKISLPRQKGTPIKKSTSTKKVASSSSEEEVSPEIVKKKGAPLSGVKINRRKKSSSSDEEEIPFNKRNTPIRKKEVLSSIKKKDKNKKSSLSEEEEERVPLRQRKGKGKEKEKEKEKKETTPLTRKKLSSHSDEEEKTFTGTGTAKQRDSKIHNEIRRKTTLPVTVGNIISQLSEEKFQGQVVQTIDLHLTSQHQYTHVKTLPDGKIVVHINYDDNVYVRIYNPYTGEMLREIVNDTLKYSSEMFILGDVDTGLILLLSGRLLEDVILPFCTLYDANTGTTLGSQRGDGEKEGRNSYKR